MTAGVIPVHTADSHLRHAGDILGGGAEVQGEVQGLGVVLLQLQAVHEVQCIAGAAGLQLQGSPAAGQGQTPHAYFLWLLFQRRHRCGEREGKGGGSGCEAKQPTIAPTFVFCYD